MPVSADRPFAMRDGRVLRASARVLTSIDFSLGSGEFVVLLGANGSGKSTLVKALLRLLPLAGGSLEIFGQPASRFEAWHRIGYVPQRPSAAAGVPATVSEVVVSGRIGRARRWRGWSRVDRARAAEAMGAVGLEHLASRPVAALSGGQQQRVLVARALAGEPDVLVLDEPVAGMDVDSQQAFASTLEALHGQGRTVLLVAHELGALEPLVSRAVLLEAGGVVYDGPPLPHLVHHEHVHHHPGVEMTPGNVRRRTT